MRGLGGDSNGEGTVMTCEEARASEMADRYVTGTFTRDQREAFERHFFECRDCFDRVEALQMARQVLEEEAQHAALGSRSTRRPARWLWLGAAAAATVLLAVGVVTMRSGSRSETSPMTSRSVSVEPRSESGPGSDELVGEGAGVEPPATTREEPGHADLLATLTAVDPPPYEAVVLRSVGDEATRRFKAGMASYQRGDFDDAVSELLGAAAADAARPDIAFYLGASLLLTHADDEAAREFARVLEMGESAYTEEAHFYLAKALLRTARLEQARAELEAVVATRGPLAQRASEMLRQLDALSRQSPEGPPD